MGSKRWDATEVVPLLESLQGKRLEKLRAQIRWQLREHPDADLRVALATHYRIRGVRSQAARWGVVVAGWSTPEEIQELRHWLLGRFRGGDEVRELLGLPADQPLPPDVADLADPAFRSRGHERVVGSGGCVSFIVMAFLGILTLGTVINAAGWWARHLWQPFPGPSDRSQAVTSLVVLAVSAVALALAYLVFRRVTRVESPTPGSFQPVVSRLFATELAWSLADEGDARGATILLRALLTTGNDPQQARRALVQLSRDHRQTDMAGRWGIAISGLTTLGEQEAFAGAVRTHGGSEAALRELALVRYDETLAPEATRVLELARNASRSSHSPRRL